MRTIPENFIKNTYNYTLLLRGERSCIYRQEVAPNKSCYEVCLIKVKKEKIIFGKIIPAREVLPPDEAWGRQGWTCYTFEKAKMIFDKLEKNQKP